MGHEPVTLFPHGGGRLNLLWNRRRASATEAGIPIFEVEMVAMRRVVVGTQNRTETLARTLLDGAQEVALLSIPIVPVIGYANAPSVLEYESGDVDRLGPRMGRAA